METEDLEIDGITFDGELSYNNKFMQTCTTCFSCDMTVWKRFNRDQAIALIKHLELVFEIERCDL